MSLPLLVLAGSDRGPHYLPPGGRDKHPLTGCKGADLRVGNCRLVDAVLDRYRAFPRELGPCYVAGPAAAYDDIEGAALIDTDGDFGENVAAGVEAVRTAHSGSAIAVATCDVLPAPEELGEVLERYRASPPSDLWFPLVRAPADERALGASAWKPRYQILQADGERVAVLPGHLAIFDPDAIRLDFVYRILQLAYRSRNRSVRYRRWFMIRRLVSEIFYREWLELRAGRLPTVALDVLSAFRAAKRLGNGDIRQSQLESALRRLFVRREHRRRYPERRTALPIFRALSLACDIDTVEEAEALGATAYSRA